ncbi:helix-turn-helix transcriptional regulator [Methylobacterium sp. ap11]|uniref:helix-turn-helix domain-containing protein n=1 Tax=Methylobacterium sp. ap11 TaxID=1761799 RepID=UPI0015A54CF8|nr:helix-turn-helix transcriptional regulator [Methylobacterium sp. ap11]
MEEISDSATVAYIRHVLHEMQISPTALAKKAGVSSTTLTRPLNKPDHKFNLSASTIEKIHKISGINPGPFFNNSDFASRSLAAIHDKDAYDPEIWGGNDSDLVATLVIGGAGLGVWQEIGKAWSTQLNIMDLTYTGYKSNDCFAVRILDDHILKHGYVDDYLLCIRFGAYKHEVTSGQTVLLERRRDGGRLIELTARRVQKLKEGWQLSTYGRGRLAQDQVVLAELTGDPDAEVIGVVGYVVKPI